MNLDYTYTNATKEMALTKDVESKSDYEFGLRIAQQMSGNIGSANSYFQTRNARFRTNRLFANGKINVRAMFQDMLNMDGEENYANLDWKAFLIVSTIVSRLVGKWKQRKCQVQTTAIDVFSAKEKYDKFKKSEFILGHKEMLGQLQDQSGVPMIGQDDFVPEDEESLNTWVIEGNRLPEEIAYELACNNVFQINGLYDTIQDKYYHDSSEVGLVCAYVEMNEEGVVIPRYIQPENSIYSYSNFADFRDTEIRGEMLSKTISELRALYGDKFTEKQFFELAQTAKEWNRVDKLTWNDDYVWAWSRPYDDWNIDLIQFEYRTFDTDVYKIKETKNGTLIVEKNPAPNDKQGTRRVKGKWNIYKGVYAKERGIVLEWGLKTNMIRPNDPKEIGEVEFGYCFYMYDNYEMRNVAVPEKIEVPVRAMMLDLLKMQQCIASARPVGAAIDVDAISELDLGLANISQADDVGKIYDQTGKLYYRSRDASGRPIPIPITELANTGFLPQMQGFIQSYQFHYQTLRDQLGVDPNLIQAASTPRVGVQNVQVAQNEADSATDYMFYAVMSLYKDVSKKVACLLSDSITYGAKAYRKLLKEEDVKGRIFTTDMQLMPTDLEIADLRNSVNQAIATNPDLLMFIDISRIFRVAKTNVKLAELYFNQSQKAYRKYIEQQKQTDVQNNMQSQMASNQQAAQAKAEQTQLESQVEMQKAKTIADGSSKVALVNLAAKWLEGGMPNANQLMPFMSTLIENLMLPMLTENQELKKQIMQQMQAEQAGAAQAAQDMQQGQGQLPPNQGGQPEEVQEMQQGGDQDQGMEQQEMPQGAPMQAQQIPMQPM